VEKVACWIRVTQILGPLPRAKGECIEAKEEGLNRHLYAQINRFEHKVKKTRERSGNPGRQHIEMLFDK